ncbi:MAG: molybdenum cofactor biosynthesis protein MoaE [Bacteroidales bacterium]|nr:molybdenum cofactor biosynthesis protein MoaE [Bacteroidales bacterium]
MQTKTEIIYNPIIQGPLPVTKLLTLNNGFCYGAEVTFTGKVRPDIKADSKVTAIEFEVHYKLVIKEIENIIAECKKKFGIINAGVWHSTGKVSAGETCFFVKVESQHRKESFKGLQYIVDEVKKRCPIFGKEILKNGEYVWKENTSLK